MYEKFLKCILCGQIHPLTQIYQCEKCGGILDITFDYPDHIKEMVKCSSVLKIPETLLPLKEGHYIRMGQGNTPLVDAGKLAEIVGVDHIWLKCEFANPTGSFKDRPVSVGISKAVEFEQKKVVVASSGNGAVAVSAFCARSGLEALILVPDSTPQEKVKQAIFHGGRVIKIKGTYSRSYQMAKKISTKLEIFNLTTTFINPYTIEGNKLVTYELFEQMNGETPDAIVVPIGTGPLMVGIYKGYLELLKMGLIQKLPRMIGAQSQGCNPIAEAYEQGKTQVKSIEHPHTVAGGICDGLTGYEQDGNYALKTILDSNGFSVGCNDQHILEAQKLLAEKEGFFVEPSSATAVAVAKEGIARGYLQKRDRIVLLMTGSGLKDMNCIDLQCKNPPIIEHFEELEPIVL